MPAQRGTATTKAFGGAYPIAAPTGLATGDIVDLIIVNYAVGARSLTGFDVLVDITQGGGVMRVLRGEITGTPPSGFTPTGGITDDEVICVAYSAGSTTGDVVSTFVENDAGDGLIPVPGVTVADNDSLLIWYSTGTVSAVTGPMTALSGASVSDIRGWSRAASAGATGTVTGTTGAFGDKMAAILSLPPSSLIPPAPLWSYRSPLLRR